VTVSYLEVYKEELADLLANDKAAPAKLQIVEAPKTKKGGKGKGIHCHGLVELVVDSPEDVIETLQIAEEKRQVGETRMNKHSSRSHCMFTMSITTNENVGNMTLQRTGRLHMVDLAGSECAKTAGNGSKTREAERAHINQVLRMMWPY
jgi:kinesin family protein 11